MLPSEKVLYLAYNHLQTDELRVTVYPDMLYGDTHTIYRKFHGGWSEPITEREMEIFSQFDENSIGYIPVNFKTLRDELKQEFEGHFMRDLTVKIIEAKEKGIEPKHLLEEVQRVTKAFSTDEYNFMAELENVLNERADTKKGFDTGFDFLKSTKGLKKGHLWVIGGYTSTGKTMFTLQALNHAMKNGASVVFVSLEMTKTEITDRLINIAQRGNHEDTPAVDEVAKYKFKCTDKIHNLEQIETLMLTNPADIFVFDFIQNIEADGKSEYERITNVVRKLQLLAHKAETCVIAVSQISNDGARTESNVMTFKGTGAIASAADVAIELRVKKEQKSKDYLEEEASIRKNRHGGMGSGTIRLSKKGIFTEVISYYGNV